MDVKLVLPCLAGAGAFANLGACFEWLGLINLCGEADLLHVPPAGVLGGGRLPHLHSSPLQAGHVPSVSKQDLVTLRGHGFPGISE